MFRNGSLMKKLFPAFLVLFLTMAVAVSGALAGSMMIPAEVEGCTVMTQYRRREQKIVRSDTLSAYAEWAFLGREYGDWGAWSDWSGTAAFPSEIQEVEERTGESGPEYRTRTRTCSYLYGRWGAWSDWTDQVLTASETVQVETRKVSVCEIPDSAVNAEDAASLVMLAGTGVQMALPGETGAVRWFSNSTEIVSVDMTGYVSARSAGTTVVYAKTEDGDIAGSITVQVLGSAARVPEDTAVIGEEAYADTALQAVDLRNSDNAAVGPLAFSGNDKLKLVVTDGYSGTLDASAFDGSEYVTFAARNRDNAYLFAEAKNLSRYLYSGSRTYAAVSGIRLSAGEKRMTVNESFTLQAEVIPANATTPYLFWYSNGDAVRVDNMGRVDAVRPGTATVTAISMDGRVRASCMVTVEGVPVSSIMLNKTELVLTEGETALLSAVTEPADATDPSLAWYSDNPNVASVVDGVVSANAQGSTVVHAFSNDEDPVIVSCRVTVLTSAEQDDRIFTGMSESDVTEDDATISAEVSLEANPDLLGFYIGTDPEHLDLGAIEDTMSSGETLLTGISYRMSEWGRILESGTKYYYQFYMTFGERTVVSGIGSFMTPEHPGDEADGGIVSKGNSTEVRFSENVKDGLFLNYYFSDVYDKTFKIRVEIPDYGDYLGVETIGCRFRCNGYEETAEATENPMEGETFDYDYNRDVYFFEFTFWLRDNSDWFELQPYFIYSDGTYYGVTYTAPARSFSITELNQTMNLNFFTSASIVELTETKATFEVKFTVQDIRLLEQVNCALWYNNHYDQKGKNTNLNNYYDPATQMFCISFSFDLDSRFDDYDYHFLVKYDDILHYTKRKVFTKPVNPVTVRVAAAGNFTYNTKEVKKSWIDKNLDISYEFLSSGAYQDPEALYDYYFGASFVGSTDPYGNDIAPICNVEHLKSMYSGTSYVGAKNVKVDIDLAASDLWNFYYSSLKDADYNDISIIYFSGHGNDPASGAGYGFIGVDDVVLNYKNIESLADEIDGTLIIIADTCHSGSLADYFRRKNRTDVCVIAACPSKDTIHSRPGNHGTYLTYHFLKGIGWKSIRMLADVNFDNKVTVSEISNFIKPLVIADTNILTLNISELLSGIFVTQYPESYIPDNLASVVIYQRDSR